MDIDWKLKLLQILHAVGQSEGVNFSPWKGVNEEEQKIIISELDLFESGLNRPFSSNKD